MFPYAPASFTRHVTLCYQRFTNPDKILRNVPLRTCSLCSAYSNDSCRGVRVHPMDPGAYLRLTLTRYSFTPKLSCTRQSSWYCPAHLYRSHDCNTIAIQLHTCCAIYDAYPTPPLYAIHNTILAMAISCNGQI